jgi:hypothetical protein
VAVYRNAYSGARLVIVGREGIERMRSLPSWRRRLN